MENTVGERVKLLRENLKLTQSEFSGRMGISTTGLWKLETGESNPRRGTLLAICKEFGVSQEWLIHGVGELKIEDFQQKRESENGNRESNWKEEAYQIMKAQNAHLLSEIELLRDVVRNMMGSNRGGQGLPANFNYGIVEALIFGKKSDNIVRVAA